MLSLTVSSLHRLTYNCNLNGHSLSKYKAEFIDQSGVGTAAASQV